MENKQRHGCLAAWLIFMMIGNALVSILYFLVSPDFFKSNEFEITHEVKLLFGVLGLFNLIFAIGVWKWKKWAFYGYAISGLMMFFTNLNYGRDLLSSTVAFFGVLLLYNLLLMRKGEKSGWENLE